MSKNSYTFRGTCDVCGGKPVLQDLGMCAVCTFGEADSMWEWLYERWEGKELVQAQKYLRQQQRELSQYNMSFSPEIASRVGEILALKNVK